MNDFEKKTEQLEKKLHNLRELNSSIKVISCMINVKNLEEHIVEYGVQECWHEYEFMMNEVIYHIHNYIDRLRIILERLPIHEGDCSIAMGESIISYELDALLVSFWRINDNHFFGEMKRCVKEELRKKLDQIFLRKGEVEYWRLKMLRDRAAHCTMALYQTVNDRAIRLYPITSKVNICSINNGCIELKTTLIDVSKIPRIEYIISSLLEENKSDNNEIDLPGILVRAQDLKLSPKGIRRKSPQVYYPTSDILFDTYSDFFNLAENVLEYMRQISDIFYNAMQEKV